MDSILFIVSLLSLLLVAGWYVGNEATGGSGAWGLLAISMQQRGQTAAEAGPRYKASERVAPGRANRTVLEKAASAAPQRVRFAEKGAGKFLNKDESGYRQRGRLPIADERRDGGTKE